MTDPAVTSMAPSASIVAWGLLLLCGLILWAAGRRVLMPVTATLALIGGVLVGYTAGIRIDLGAPAWVIASVGALLCMSVALLAFRAIVAMGMATIFALAAPLAVWGGAELGGHTDDTDESLTSFLGGGGDPDTTAPPDLVTYQEPEEDFDEWWVRDDSTGADVSPINATLPPAGTPSGARVEEIGDDLRAMSDHLPFNPEVNQAVGEGVDHATEYAGQAVSWGESIWQRTPEKLRFGMITAALVGAITGLLIGSVANKTSVSVVTSFGGSLLWIMASLALVRDIGLSADPTAVFGPPLWMGMWIVVAIIGLSIQWTFRPRRADVHA
jgi:hypothetical protein